MAVRCGESMGKTRLPLTVPFPDLHMCSDPPEHRGRCRGAVVARTSVIHGTETGKSYH